MEKTLAEERSAAVEAVRTYDGTQELGERLWKAIELHAGQQFYTSKKLPFMYTIKGGELFCDRKEKSITKATILRAYEKIRTAEGSGEPIRGPKQLSMFGAPYIWSILKGIGLM